MSKTKLFPMGTVPIAPRIVGLQINNNFLQGRYTIIAHSLYHKISKVEAQTFSANIVNLKCKNMARKVASILFAY